MLAIKWFLFYLLKGNVPVRVKVKSTAVLMWAKGEGQAWPGISSLVAAHRGSF